MAEVCYAEYTDAFQVHLVTPLMLLAAFAQFKK